MKHLPCKRAKFVVLCAFVALGVNWAVGTARSQIALYPLTRQLPTDAREGLMVFQKPFQWRLFNALWAQRFKRDISNDLLPVLRAPTPAIRLRAARVLGRMENAKAQRPIEALLKEPGHPIPPMLLQLPLGRIKSRGLTGQAKVEAFVGEVGLTWGDAVRLSQVLNGPSANRSVNTNGEDVMDELADVLHDMAKKGEDVKPLASQLTLRPSQQIWIEAGALDDMGEAHLVLNYLFGVSTILGETHRLCDHLSESNPALPQVCLSYLEDMKQHPDKYYGLLPSPPESSAHPTKRQCSSLIELAARTGDPRVLPYLRYFSKYPMNDDWLQRQVKRELENFDLRANGSFPA